MIAPDTRVQAYCSNVAPLAGSNRSTAAIRASRPHETRSSSSQWAGSSRTLRQARYLTIGAYDRTRRSRAATSPFWIQARQSASAVDAVGRWAEVAVSTELNLRITGTTTGANSLGSDHSKNLQTLFE